MHVPPKGIRPQLKIVAQTTLPTTFGPFLVLGALEWLYLAGEISRLIPPLAAFG